jgi:hypothetical protein
MDGIAREVFPELAVFLIDTLIRQSAPRKIRIAPISSGDGSPECDCAPRRPWIIKQWVFNVLPGFSCT